MRKIFTKIKDYFTANSCRKIFFFGLVLGLLIFFANVFIGLYALQVLGALCCIVAVGASLVDSMQVRVVFLRQIKQMQYDHLQEIFDQQQAGKDVPVTPTFTDAEKKYLKRKKWAYVGAIFLKLAFVICLFFLIFN